MGTGFLSGAMKMSWNWTVEIISQPHEYIKDHWMVHFKMVHFMVCEFHLHRIKLSRLTPWHGSTGDVKTC